jgi:hypothetical protein
MLTEDIVSGSLPAQPWAVFDAREHGRSAVSELASFCQRRGIQGAFLTTDAGSRANSPELLTIEHGPVFTAEGDSLPGRLLDALDADQPISIDSGPAWRGVYGPTLVDGVLDLLLDGATGHMRFTPSERWSRTQFACLLADVAGHDRSRFADEAVEFDALAQWDSAGSQLPPTETVMERFVADRRRMRKIREERLPDGSVELYLEAAE